MKKTIALLCGIILCGYLISAQPVFAAAQPTDNGKIEFRVGNPQSATVPGARVIVINHDGKVIATGLTDTQGIWTASAPYYKIQWNKGFNAKGIVNAIVVADGYNEQVVFVVPIGEHTIQPVVLQPIKPNGRNAPSASLGNTSLHDLRLYIAHYADVLKLKKQAVIPGDPAYQPWSAEQQVGSK